jgi:hypothetical protein
MRCNSMERYETLWKELVPDPQAEIWDFVRALPAEEKSRLRDYASKQAPPQPAYTTADIGYTNGLGAFNLNTTEEAARHHRIITVLQTI